MMSEAQLPDDATANDTAAAVSTDKARSESFSSAGGTHNNISAQTQHLNGGKNNNTTNYQPESKSGEGSSMASAAATTKGTTMTRAAVSSSNTHPLSAPMSVLGANSDRNDYYLRHNSSPSNNNDDGSSSADNSSSSNHNTLGKVKAWFASGDNTSADNDHNTAHDYREFSTPSNNKHAHSTATKKFMNSNNNNNNDNDGDVELQQQSQYHRNTEQEEEERVVMEKCSFVYGEPSPDNKYKPSHRIPSIDPHYSNEESDDEHYNNRNSKNNSSNINNNINVTTNLNNGEYNYEENQEYFGRNYYYQNNRRISPSAVAHALTSRAKRTWTERRYRRRLRQSQFIPPNTTTTTGYTAGHDDSNGQSPTSSSLPSIPTQPPASFHYELTSEHRHAFLAAHAALNSKLPNEQYRNRHANLRLDGHRGTGNSNSVNNNDLQFDIDGVDGTNDDEEELRADLTKSSLAIRGGLIRLPTDNVRLVCDARLQPGILSIETRDVGGVHGTGTQGYEMFGNANRYGNIHGNMMMRMMNGGGGSGSNSAAGDTDSNNTRQQSERMADSWKRHELAYVLTVDEHIYQRLAQEMGDSYRVPWGIYFCCRETEGGGNHVGIEAAVLILLVIFILLIAGMIAWPTS